MPTGALSRVWRCILILGPTLVVAVAFQSLWSLRISSAHPNSDEMSVETDRLALLIDAYISRVVGVTSYLAIAPEVVTLAQHSDKPITDKDKEIEKDWRKLTVDRSDKFTRDIRPQPLSKYFSDLKASDGAYREIFLADRHGKVLAASNRTENYLQINDRWWPKNLENARPEDLIACRHLPLKCVRISGMEWDSSAGLVGYYIVIPVATPEGKWVGALKAVIDPKELNNLLNFAAYKEEEQIGLVDAEGVEVFSGEPFFGKKNRLGLSDLDSGGEGSWSLDKSRQKGPIAFVRRLSSPVVGGWFIAVADREVKDDGNWKAYLMWCLLVLGLFLVAAGAFSVRVQAAVETPIESEIL